MQDFYVIGMIVSAFIMGASIAAIYYRTRYGTG